MDRDEEKEQEGRKSCDTSVGLHCFTFFVNGSRERVKGNEKRLGGLSTFNFWMIFFSWIYKQITPILSAQGSGQSMELQQSSGTVIDFILPYLSNGILCMSNHV